MRAYQEVMTSYIVVKHRPTHLVLIQGLGRRAHNLGHLIHLGMKVGRSRHWLLGGPLVGPVLGNSGPLSSIVLLLLVRSSFWLGSRCVGGLIHNLFPASSARTLVVGNEGSLLMSLLVIFLLLMLLLGLLLLLRSRPWLWLLWPPTQRAWARSRGGNNTRPSLGPLRCNEVEFHHIFGLTFFLLIVAQLRDLKGGREDFGTQNPYVISLYNLCVEGGHELVFSKQLISKLKILWTCPRSDKIVKDANFVCWQKWFPVPKICITGWGRQGIYIKSKRTSNELICSYLWAIRSWSFGVTKVKGKKQRTNWTYNRPHWISPSLCPMETWPCIEKDEFPDSTARPWHF